MFVFIHVCTVSILIFQTDTHKDLDGRSSTLLFRDTRRRSLSVWLLLIFVQPFFPSTLLSLPVLFPRFEMQR